MSSACFLSVSLSQTISPINAPVSIPTLEIPHHDLRHTVVTYLLEAGQSPKTVQEFIGHTSTGFILRQYAHVVEEGKRQSAKLLNQLFISAQDAQLLCPICVQCFVFFCVKIEKSPKTLKFSGIGVAAELGFEPRQYESES